jgi:hypothetical protein
MARMKFVAVAAAFSCILAVVAAAHAKTNAVDIASLSAKDNSAMTVAINPQPLPPHGEG